LELEDWQEVHDMTKNSLFRTNESLSSSLAAVASLERSLAGAYEKYLYMRQLRDYVSVLCEFLQVRHFVLSGILKVLCLGGVMSVRHTLLTNPPSKGIQLQGQ
jgi:hypothetical protein